MFALSKVKLHKVDSNITTMIDAVPAEDRAKDINDLDPTVDDLPVQRSLGLRWKIMADTFVFKALYSSRCVCHLSIACLIL